MQLLNHDISMYDESFLAKTQETRMAAIGCKSPAEYAALLVRDSAEQEVFYASLHVGYSQFFRNHLTYAVLEKIVLPELLKKALGNGRREIRIWSAGCSAGQEPYSIAILLEEIIVESKLPIDYRIFATDARESRIVKARTGRFSDEVLGNISLKRLGRYFVHQGFLYTIASSIAAHVDFSVFDQLDNTKYCPPSSIFGDFDLILCCNMLYYYNAEARKLILSKLTNCLGSNAYLVTGETERGFIIENGYSEVFEQAAVFKHNKRPLHGCRVFG
jgi:chemotaxis methyl-accepting protein methylase